MGDSRNSIENKFNDLAVLMAVRKYRIPFRTPKSSSPAAMVLHLEVWESSSAQPLFTKSPILIRLGLFLRG